MKDKLTPCENVFCFMFHKISDLNCVKCSTKSEKYFIEICKNKLAFDNLKKKIKARIEEHRKNILSTSYYKKVFVIKYKLEELEWVLEQIEGEENERA